MEIELFMWEFQHSFRIEAEIFAKKVFKILDENLEPRVYLIGFLSNNKENSYQICIEPEDGDYKPYTFSATMDLALALAKTNRMNISLKEATEKTINEWDCERISFCSLPMLIEGYCVLVLLQFDRELFESNYSLKKNITGKIYNAVSLLDATVVKYLSECSRMLDKPNPGKTIMEFDRDPYEIIKSAGKYLMYTTARAGQNFNGLGGLFEHCDTISSLRYEGEDNCGKLIIAKQYDFQNKKKKKQYHPNIKVIIELDSPIKINDYRAVRKLLEMSSGNLSLLCDSFEIYGLGKLSGDYNSNREDLFLINFVKHYQWELLHDNKILMKVTYGQPNLPKELLDEKKFKDDIKRIFVDNINDRQIENLWDLLIEATKQKHGTMVVISDEAEVESNRLRNQSTKIKPVVLTPEMINVVTNIDGSVLINQNSVCYALGVILDGVASNNETSSRGARYNSAIRYIENNNSNCMAIVISEDGMIDVIPSLMPQISYMILEKMLKDLKKSSLEEDFKKFNKVMLWFDNHRFYLNYEICREINNIYYKVEKLMTERKVFHTVYSVFEPNDEIDDSYFLDTN